MLENLINQLLAEEKEEGLGKKFLEASETVLEALISTRAAMVVSLHSSLGKPGVKKHRACLLGPSLWPATSPNQLRSVSKPAGAASAGTLAAPMSCQVDRAHAGCAVSNTPEIQEKKCIVIRGNESQ